MPVHIEMSIKCAVCSKPLITDSFLAALAFAVLAGHRGQFTCSNKCREQLRQLQRSQQSQQPSVHNKKG